MISSANNARRHPSNLNFELNLRTYLGSRSFTSQKAWEYPRAPSIDPVAIDKPSFGHAHQLPRPGTSVVKGNKKGAEAAEDRRFERQDSKVEAKPTAPLTNYLSTDANAPKYHIKYRVKNVSELKSLLTKQSNQPTLDWQASLRPNLGNNATFVTTRTIPKRCVSTLDNTGNLVADDTRKRRRRRDEQ